MVSACAVVRKGERKARTEHVADLALSLMGGSRRQLVSQASSSSATRQESTSGGGGQRRTHASHSSAGASRPAQGDGLEVGPRVDDRELADGAAVAAGDLARDGRVDVAVAR